MDPAALARITAVLPDHLRGAAITPLGGGLSGAAVYRIDGPGGAYVLKVAPPATPPAAWRQRLAIQRAAGDAGLAPRVVHADEAGRAVVSELVPHRGPPRPLFDPRTRAGALTTLGETIRRVHALPLPPGATWLDPRDLIAPARAALATFAVPRFARAAIDEEIAGVTPPAGPLVTSHNDLNPSNLAYDGARLVLLDWDLAGPNDPWFDLATVALFLRLDEAAASALIAAYAAAPPAPLPAAFRSARRLVAAVCATMFLERARAAGHPGGEIEAARAPTLAEVHGLVGIGALALGGADGAWAFGLALARTLADERPV